MSAAYWAMQLFKPPVRAVAAAPKTMQLAPKLDAAAGLFGGRAVVVVASNFQLKGVVVADNPAESVAILETSGRPTKAVRANAEVMPGVTVKEVQRGYVLLSEGGAIKRVELPEKAKGRGGVTTSPVPVRSPVPRVSPIPSPIPSSKSRSSPSPSQSEDDF